jgi:glycine/D-amino acid oxidase-like deaminating enzyme
VPGLENVFVVAGFSGHGFKLSPSVGLGMAQLLLGDPVTAFDLAFFAPGRFAPGSHPPGSHPPGTNRPGSNPHGPGSFGM